MSDNLFTVPASSDPPKLLDRLPAGLRFKHYSIRTESAYTGWIRRFIRFHFMECVIRQNWAKAR
ncbi:phage integrase N-terminal SAM-like domain-containing protein [Propionivibrio sp.]|uniref:phage integrase N-terminal SAM-like domain-containing protein n=1 Tax=Propionivibrio sp. TaxID=2212460 RepID=UPI00341948CB